MAERLIEVHATFQDHEGEKSTVRFFVESDNTYTMGDIDETVTALVTSSLRAASTSKLVGYSWTVRTWTGFTYPAMTVYGDSEDKAYLEFRSQNTGQLYTLSIPSPAEEIFAADKETVDPADGLMVNLIQDVTQSYATKSADTDMQYIRGYRLRKKSRKERPGYSTAQG